MSNGLLAKIFGATPPPLSNKATAPGVWIFYTLFVFTASFVEEVGALGRKPTHRTW
jgi:hypothetical protein